MTPWEFFWIGMSWVAAVVLLLIAAATAVGIVIGIIGGIRGWFPKDKS